MSSKVKLQLVTSTRMGENGEHDIIRFPLNARKHFDFTHNRVVIGKGVHEVSLMAKQAYKADVRRLANMIRNGRISEENARSVGFVSRQVRDKVTRRKGGDDIWVTDGVGSITVGADPEFGLIDNDNILIRGNRVIPKAGKFGSDGPGVEVRPAPSSNHLEVVKNIGNILENPPASVDRYRWQGGATYQDSNRVYWFGGHVHLGRPAQLAPDTAYPIYEGIATCLDSMLALPMVRFDTPSPHLRRNGCLPHKYGKAGDIRTKGPGQDRFEYRVLSGLWLVHPALATIAIGAAKCITETAYGRLAETGFDPDWANNPPTKKGLLHSLGVKGLQEVRAIVNKAQPSGVTEDRLRSWEGWLRGLDRFDDYGPELRALIALTKEDPGTIETGMCLDIRRNWQEGRTLLPKANKQLRKALDRVEEKRL